MFYKLLFIGALTVLARMAGGGLGARILGKKGKLDDNGNDAGGRMPVGLGFLPEVVFGILFGVGFYQLTLAIPFLADLPHEIRVLWAMAAGGWSYAWMETGHGIVLLWGRDVNKQGYAQDVVNRILEDAKTRTQTLKPVVDFLAKKLHIEPKLPDGTYTVQYCRLFMSVKGFLIGLPFGGIPFIIAWPLSYEIGVRVKSHPVSEMLTGFFSGLIITMTVAFARIMFN